MPICPFCLEVFYSGEALFITSNNTFMERQADVSYLYNEIAQHLYLHASSIGTYDCDNCVLTFTSSSDLIVHQKFSHTNIKTRTDRQLVDETSNFKFNNFLVCQAIQFLLLIASLCLTTDSTKSNWNQVFWWKTFYEDAWHFTSRCDPFLDY